MARSRFRWYFPTVLVACGAVALIPASLPAQVGPTAFLVDSLRVTPADSVVFTTSRFVQTGTESLSLDGSPLLMEGTDYRLDLSAGRVVLATHVRALMKPAPASSVLIIRYRALPVRFRDSYRLPAAESILLQGRPVVVSASRHANENPDWFGRGLQRSGSIVRGVTVGTNRDASLTSGLRLQLSGELASDVNVVAALTDENSPLQPEGATQTLREVDRVFIDISGRQYGMTLGDFVYARDRVKGGAFGSVSRKFQGVQASMRGWEASAIGLKTTVGVVGASARGKFRTNRFQGRDGNQGPYRLVGENGEPRVIVIAGSERITINGELMVRGEVQDFVIDYASGEVLFTGRRRITSASRIVVDFEYADRQYARNALGATIDAMWGDSSVVVYSGILQEADDPDASLDFTLDENLRSLLRSSGADRLQASLSSVRSMGIDTTTGRGAGQYLRVDSLVQGRSVSIYRYAPGDPQALYAVSFAPVERMPSDSAGYVRVSSGEYRFAGVGAGTYLPVQFIPIPQLQRSAHATIRVRPHPALSILADLGGSVLDRNRLSAVDDADNTGSAQILGLELSPSRVRVGPYDLGEVALSLSQRTLASTFVAPDRIDPAEYERTWDLPSARAAEETRREARLSYQPRSWLRSGGFVGTVNRPGEVFSRRAGGNVSLSDSIGSQLSIETETVRRDLAADGTSSSWRRQGAFVDVPMRIFRPSFRLIFEDRSDHHQGVDSLVAGSYRMLEWTPRIAWVTGIAFSAAAEWQIRTEDSTLVGIRSRAFDAWTQAYTAEVRPIESIQSSLALNVRRTTFTEDFRLRGNGDATTVLVRSHTRFATPRRSTEGDVLYEFSNQRSARLERVFVRVARGTGNYRYAGDTNGNGIADETEYELVRFDGDFVALLLPGEALVPVNDVKASVRVRWNGGRGVEGAAGGLWRALSTETLIRAEERSSDPIAANVYGLRLGTFLAGATTLSGAQTITQDLHVFEGDTEFSLRLRIGERRGLTQFVTAPERTYGNERSVRLRTRWSAEIGNQTDLWVKRDRLLSANGNPRERDLTGAGGMADFTYRIERRWEAGWSLGVSSVTDRRAGRSVEAAMNEQAVRVVYGIPLSGQVRAEVRREEARVAASTGIVPALIPFELTEGKAVGRSWLWRLSADLQVTSLIQLSLGYFGRQEGTGPVVHTARAEARATF